MKDSHSAKRAIALLMVAALMLASAALAANLPLPTAESTSSITARDLKKHLSFLASDELGGRYTLSPSNRVAARYLASQLEAYGYRGGARDGSYFQRVPLSYREVDRQSSHVTLNIGGTKREFNYADAFLADVPTDMNIGGGLVFVGYGVSSPKNNYDDYAGLKVKGNIVVMATGMPDSISNVRLSDVEQGESAALAHGSTAVIRIPDAQTLLSWDQLKVFLIGQQLGLPPRKTVSGKTLPEITAGPELIKAIARTIGKDSSDLVAPANKIKPSELATSAEIKLRVEVKEAPPAQNVVGILDGADQRLKEEYVVFSAHYDHLKTTDKGEVYHGADDDGLRTL